MRIYSEILNVPLMNVYNFGWFRNTKLVLLYNFHLDNIALGKVKKNIFPKRARPSETQILLGTMSV